MKKLCALGVCAVLMLASFGCKQDSRPADLPDDMTPTFITITQEGVPVPDATIELQYTTNVKYTTSGTTDASGVATLITYGYAGAQQGTAKVRVEKIVNEGGSESEDYGESGSLGEDFNVIDAKYGSFSTTDLEITVDKSKKVEQTFEVGPAVHEKRK